MSCLSSGVWESSMSIFPLVLKFVGMPNGVSPDTMASTAFVLFSVAFLTMPEMTGLRIRTSKSPRFRIVIWLPPSWTRLYSQSPR